MQDISLVAIFLWLEHGCVYKHHHAPDKGSQLFILVEYGEGKYVDSVVVRAEILLDRPIAARWMLLWK